MPPFLWDDAELMQPLFKAYLRRWIRCLDRILFPRVCVLCGEPEPTGLPHVCAYCLPLIELIQKPHCVRCGAPFDGEATMEMTCDSCRSQRCYYESGLCCIRAVQSARTLIHLFKYHQALFLLRDFGLLMRQIKGIDAFLDQSILVPVPLHRSKLRSRGFNQSLLIANLLEKNFTIETISPILRRVRNTPSQTRLTRLERKQNMQNAFAVVASKKVSPQKSYVLIDDVITTGSTLNACAKSLYQAGARKIKVFALAHG